MHAFGEGQEMLLLSRRHQLWDHSRVKLPACHADHAASSRADGKVAWRSYGVTTEMRDLLLLRSTTAAAANHLSLYGLIKISCRRFV